MKKTDNQLIAKQVPTFSDLAFKALKQAGKQARSIARMHKTRVFVIREGKIVGDQP